MRRQSTNAAGHQQGFTLIELIIVIVITGVLSVGITNFVGSTSKGYVDTADRQRMASAMVVASEVISRSLRTALPNSVRIGGGATNNCIELVPVLRGGYYVSIPKATAAASFTAVAMGNAAAQTGQIAVYPVSQDAVYSPSDVNPAVLTAAAATVPAGTDTITITLGASHRFPLDSPNKRMYLVGTPIAYCQPAGSARMYRYSGYGFNAVTVLPPTGGTREVLIDELDAGNETTFAFSDAVRQRNAVVRFNLIAKVDNEQLQLDQEVQVRNVP